MCSRNNLRAERRLSAFWGQNRMDKHLKKRLASAPARSLSLLWVLAFLLAGALIAPGGAQAENSETRAGISLTADPVAAKWRAMRTRIEGWDLSKIRRPSQIKVIRRTEPFLHVIAEGAAPEGGGEPVRGITFDEPQRRIVIIQNLFGSSGADIPAFNRTQFLSMLRSLLPRDALDRVFELEVVGFADIQYWGDAVDAGQCDPAKPHNNACLSLARSWSTSAILKEYVLRTRGEALRVNTRPDPDPVMHNLNLATEGRLWIATESESSARQLAQRFNFSDRLGAEMSVEDIQAIRAAAEGAPFSRDDTQTLLRPFRSAIVFAWYR